MERRCKWLLVKTAAVLVLERARHYLAPVEQILERRFQLGVGPERVVRPENAAQRP
ncbi:MAG: hypothetical protein U0587_18745 [Candidatus Binatia bacterium]